MGERRRTGSLKRRLVVTAAAILVSTLAGAALIAGSLVRRALTRDTEGVLDNRIAEIQTLLATGRLPARLEPTGPDTGLIQVTNSDGRIIATTRGLTRTTTFAPIPPPAPGTRRVTTLDGGAVDGDKGETYRLVARTIARPDGDVTVWALTSLEAATSAQRYLRNGLLLGLPIIAALAMWLIAKLVDRAVAPVDRMRADADRIEATDLSARLTAPTTDDEISHLADTLNRLLARIEHANTRQQLFAAAAAHELRSPLSAIRTEIEVALAYPDRTDWPAVAGDVLVDIDRLETLARDLRLLTRPDTIGRGEPVDLVALVSGEAARRNETSRVPIAVAADAAGIVTGDEDGIIRVIRNLLDNAERHAAARIDVAVKKSPAGVSLRVSNDGPPVPVEDRERVFEAFTRLDEARSLDAGGSGLGLAIARGVMRRHGGTLTLDDRSDTTTFVATFPRSRNDES